MDSLIGILEQIERTLLDLEYDICILTISFMITVTVIFIYHILKKEKK